MIKIGTYNGQVCYRTSTENYYEYLLEDKIDEHAIYIIENDKGKMVRDGIIIGYYDGKHVKDDYNGIKYNMTERVKKALSGLGNSAVEASKAMVDMYETMKKEKAKTANTTSLVSATGELTVPDIDFSQYSGVVDNFFKELKTKG
jgi:hypothetical protein